LLVREAERAVRAQATPAKLHAWIDSFYVPHADVCRAVYRPVVIAWAACAGVDAEAALAGIVAGHIELSQRELRQCADTEDGDELAGNLARMIRKWESERASAVADRLMTEGDRYGH
jgi:hypothetical protein